MSETVFNTCNTNLHIRSSETAIQNQSFLLDSNDSVNVLSTKCMKQFVDVIDNKTTQPNTTGIFSALQLC